MRLILSTTFVFAYVSRAQNSYSKRGLAYGSWVDESDVDIWNAQRSPLSWYYNFGMYPSSGIDPWKMQFVPMMWGNQGNDLEFSANIKGMIDSGMNISYVLGFNEPDICYGGGSCIDAATAAKTWKDHIEPLKKHGIKLGAPAVTGGDTTWLQDFFDACNGGCTADFVPLHYYSDAIGLTEWVRNIHAIYENMTIWVTEFACPDCTLPVSQLAFNESVAFLDKAPYVTHYSYFGSFRTDSSNDFLGPNVAMLNDKGGLTSIGAWYLGLPASAVGKTNIGPASPKPSKGGQAPISTLYWWQWLIIITISPVILAFR